MGSEVYYIAMDDGSEKFVTGEEEGLHEKTWSFCFSEREEDLRGFVVEARDQDVEG